MIPENGFLTLVKEGDNASGSYLRGQKYWPYYGRGLIQLTWLENYKKYGEFRQFPTRVTGGNYEQLGWETDVLLARNNLSYHAWNWADSACFYIVTKNNMLKAIDTGISHQNAISVSKFVNGDVGTHI